jgi:hypothetical protein
MNLTGVNVDVAPVDKVALALPVDRAIAGLKLSKVVPLIDIAEAAIVDETL